MQHAVSSAWDMVVVDAFDASDSESRVMSVMHANEDLAPSALRNVVLIAWKGE